MKKKLVLLLGGLGLAIFLLYSKISLVCLFHFFTGLYCPGCGISRCIKSIIALDFYQAFRYNPLVFILLPFLITYIAYQIFNWFFEREDKITKKLSGYPVYGLLMLIIVYGLLRNIPFFSFLAPTKIH